MREAPNLKYLREDRLLTQEQLAEKAGISRAAVNRIENGQPARLSTLRRLADALGVAPAELWMVMAMEGLKAAA